MSDEGEKAFSLIEEPWVRVVDKSGAHRVVSLRTLFSDISSFTNLDGGGALEDIAVFRLLLAITYASLDPVLRDDWEEWWNDGLPVDRIISYLESREDRFWLFHPEHPFMQQPDLEPINDKADTGLSRFIIEPNGNEELFANRRSTESLRVKPADAVGMLLTVLQFDTSGPKSGHKNDPYEVKGRSYTTKPLLACMSAIMIDRGSLTEDLLLALVPLNSGFIKMPGDVDHISAGVPAWDRDPLNPTDGDKNHKQQPQSILDSLTWRGRRARLWLDDDGMVDHAYRSMGLSVDLSDCAGYEPMAIWRYVKEDHKTGMPGHLGPVQYSNDKAMWRGLASMLATEAHDDSPLTAAVIRWASVLEIDGIIDDSYRASIRVITARYDTAYSAKMTEVIDDSISLPLKIFTDPDNVTRVNEAVRVAEESAKAYGLFVWRCRGALGEDGENAASSRDAERSRMYTIMEPKFYSWIDELADKPAGALSRWSKIVSTAVSKEADVYADGLPTRAMYGVKSFSSVSARHWLAVDLGKIKKGIA